MPIDIQSLLMTWDKAGLFEYVLPFLLIFAVVFGILTATNAFSGNRGVNVIIAVAIGLMSLQFGYVQVFFSQVFPRFAVALAVMLVAVILTVAFIPDLHKKTWSIAIYGLGGLAALFVILNTFSTLDWFGSFWWDEWGSTILGILLILGVIIAIVSSKPQEGYKKEGHTYSLMRNPD